jgi:hypothetical protein
MAKKRRRWDLEPEREPGQSPKPQLAQLDAASRAGVLESLQRAGGNNAVQRVFAGPQLERQPTLKEQPRTATRWVLSIDGTAVPVRSVAGGDVRVEVVHGPSPSGVELKHPAGVSFEPVSFEVGLDTGVLLDWIGSTLERKHSRKDLVLHQADTSGKDLGGIGLREALVTEIGVPKLDVGDSGDAWLRVKVQPELESRDTGSGKSVAVKGKPDPLKPSTARLEVSGIGTVADLLSVGAWTVKQGVKPWATGGSRDPQVEPTSLEVTDLVVTLAGKKSGATSFDAWFQDFVINGEHEKRTAVLTVKSHSGRTLTLTFSGVGISSAQMFEGTGGGGRQYGLYAESVSLKLK